MISFCGDDEQYGLSCQEKFKISRAIVRVTPEVMWAIEILLASIVKKLVAVE